MHSQLLLLFSSRFLIPVSNPSIFRRHGSVPTFVHLLRSKHLFRRLTLDLLVISVSSPNYLRLLFIRSRHSSRLINYSIHDSLACARFTVLMSNEINLEIDRRKLSILILFDFSKAFATVSLFILLFKLRRLGFATAVLNWLCSYLPGLSQPVINEDRSCSNWLPTTAGVPQGSVLRPLLFPPFINDISDVLRYCSHMIFENDTQIYLQCSPSDLSNALNLVNHDIHVIANYATTSGLSLNSKKSEILVFGSNPYVRSQDFTTLPPAIINDTVISYMSTRLAILAYISPQIFFGTSILPLYRKKSMHLDIG